MSHLWQRMKTADSNQEKQIVPFLIIQIFQDMLASIIDCLNVLVPPGMRHLGEQCEADSDKSFLCHRDSCKHSPSD